MKKLLIIVPGSKTKSILIFKLLLNKFYSYFGVETIKYDWPNKLKNYLEKDIDCVVFEWKGGISNTLSLNTASNKLVNFLKFFKIYDEIILFGKSLGGIVAEKAIKKINSKKIKKLIYVATPHNSLKKIFLKNLDVFNIYSNEDKYQKLANKILHFGFGSSILNNSKNIQIGNLKHSDFNYNNKVLINSKKFNLFDFYKSIILN